VGVQLFCCGEALLNWSQTGIGVQQETKRHYVIEAADL